MKKISFKSYAERFNKTQEEWATEFNTTQPTIGRWLKDEKYVVTFSRGKPVSVGYAVTCWEKNT